MLRSLLGAVEGRLESLKTTVERQQALARSVPSIWPLAGWLSSTYGRRPDPFDGSTDFHQGLDIVADRGTPVRATADGTVGSAGYSGNYGNQVLVDHGFGIGTRFGHLSKVVCARRPVRPSWRDHRLRRGHRPCHERASSLRNSAERPADQSAAPARQALAAAFDLTVGDSTLRAIRGPIGLEPLPSRAPWPKIGTNPPGPGDEPVDHVPRRGRQPPHDQHAARQGHRHAERTGTETASADRRARQRARELGARPR